LADLRFFLPAPGARFQTSCPPLSVSIEDLKAWQALDIASTHCDDSLDLAELELPPQTKLDSTCVFREIGPLRRELPSGSVFVMMGFPRARTRGLSENVAAVYSSVERPVLVEPDLPLDGYDPSEHMLVTFPSASDYEPDGFSGSGLWGNADKHDGVWSPAPVLVGTVLEYYRGRQLIKALKVDAMERFFEEAFKRRRSV
jgi:hypothetical protein